MPQPPKVINPFYVLLVLNGCAFAITASAYAVMTVRQLHHSRAAVSPANDHFTEWMDQHGPKIMCLELLLLGIGTVGAIAVDRYSTVPESRSRGSFGNRDNADARTVSRDADASPSKTRSDRNEGQPSYGD